mgnify:CR=1 FL=1
MSIKPKHLYHIMKSIIFGKMKTINSKSTKEPNKLQEFLMDERGTLPAEEALEKAKKIWKD